MTWRPPPGYAAPGPRTGGPAARSRGPAAGDAAYGGKVAAPRPCLARLALTRRRWQAIRE
jgi:hypothetical protein